MRWEYNPYTLSLVLTTAISLASIVYTWRRRSLPGVVPFIFFMIAVAELSLGYALEFRSIQLGSDLYIFWAKTEYLGIVSVPVAFILFAMQYTGRGPERIRRALLLLAFVPAVTLILVWTNELHFLIWRETRLETIGELFVFRPVYGTWFWIHTTYSYVLVGWGTVLVFRYFLRSKGVYRKQAGLIMLAASIPWMGNILYVFKVHPFSIPDLTPYSFAITGLLASIGFLRFQFFDIVPLARDAILDRMQDAVIVLDARNRIADFNPAAKSVIGMNIAQVLGQPAEQVFGEYGEMVDRFLEVRNAREVLTAGTIESPLFWELNISPLHDRRGNFTGRLIVLHDITERQLTRIALQESHAELERRVQERTAELEAANEKLRAGALHDSLTGLPNRRLFLERLERVFERSKRRPDETAAVLFMDLDRFKLINDTLGHAIGDEFLKVIADRLKESMRTSDTVARLGGDEFAILLENIQGISEAVQIAERLQQELSTPFELDGQEVFTSASIGIALASPNYNRPHEILRDADAAMYRAKARGKGRYEEFAPEHYAVEQVFPKLQEDLSRAIQHGEFQLHYQPIVDLGSGDVICVEALLRWMHPEFGLLYPRQFLQLAEESRWITPIGEWVLRSACAQAKSWHAEGYDRLRVAVNISTRQFLESGLVELVPRVLAEQDLSPHFLELEISESTVFQDIDRTMKILTELSQLGVRISIDSFGNGSVPLNQLESFPANTLKIDRSVAFDGMDQFGDASNASAIIAMAHTHRLKVVAKGVETRGQLAFLVSLQCDQIQGYLISQAVPPDLATELFVPGQQQIILRIPDTAEIEP